MMSGATFKFGDCGECVYKSALLFDSAQLIPM